MRSNRIRRLGVILSVILLLCLLSAAASAAESQSTEATISICEVSVTASPGIMFHGGFTIDGEEVSSVRVAKGGSATIAVPHLPAGMEMVVRIGDDEYITTETTIFITNIVSDRVPVYLGLRGEASVIVTFDANGGVGDMSAQTFSAGVAGTLRLNEFEPAPTWQCRQFAGWSTTPEGELEYLNGQKVTLTESLTLYAVWITVHTAETVPGQAVTCTEDGWSDWIRCSVCDCELGSPSLLVATGHKPGDPVRENEVEPTTETDGHYDLVVRCSVCDAVLETTQVTVAKITEYTTWQITYHAGAADAGRPWQDPTKYRPEEEVTVLKQGTLEKTGYVFDGWMDEHRIRYEPGDIFQITENVDLYAQWTPVTYTIRFDANGGTGAPDAIQARYDEETALPYAPEIAYDGFTFGGWAVAADAGAKYGDGVTVMNLAATDGGTATLYAVWNNREELRIVESAANDPSGNTTITTTEHEYIRHEPGTRVADILKDHDGEKIRVHLEYTEEPESANEWVTGPINLFDISYTKEFTLTVTETQTPGQRATVSVSYEMSRLGNEDIALLKDAPVYYTGARASQLAALSGSKIAGFFEGSVGDTVNAKLKEVGLRITFTLDKEWVEARYGTDETAIRQCIRAVHISGSSVKSIEYQFGRTAGGDYTVSIVSYDGFSSYAVLCDPVYYTVAYDLNGGTWASSEIPDPKILTVLEGTVIPSDEWSIPVRYNDVFVDWYTGDKVPYDKSAPVIASQTLVAKWQGSGSSNHEYTRILPPTEEPTAGPTDVPTLEPTGYPTMTSMSPAPFAGIIAGLLGAAVLMIRRRR